MNRFLERRMTNRWAAFVPVAIGVALIGCSGDVPSSPSANADGGPRLEATGQAAAARSALSVVPKNVRLQCELGEPCATDVIVTASSPVLLQWNVSGDFLADLGGSDCGGLLSESCTIVVVLTPVEEPGRYTATLTLEDLTNGTTKTVRIGARVS